jgi:hypothetical protein
MTFPHKIVLHRLGFGMSQNDDKSLQSRAHNVDRAAIMACSMFTKDDSVERILHASEDGRRLLSDKKLPFEQFEPRRLLISVSTLYYR